jgi:hypothetical protein
VVQPSMDEEPRHGPGSHALGQPCGGGGRKGLRVTLDIFQRRPAALRAPDERRRDSLDQGVRSCLLGQPPELRERPRLRSDGTRFLRILPLGSRRVLRHHDLQFSRRGAVAETLRADRLCRQGLRQRRVLRRNVRVQRGERRPDLVRGAPVLRSVDACCRRDACLRLRRRERPRALHQEAPGRHGFNPGLHPGPGLRLERLEHGPRARARRIRGARDPQRSPHQL